MASNPFNSKNHKNSPKPRLPKTTTITVDFFKDLPTLAAIDAACVMHERRRAAHVRLICREWADRLTEGARS